MKLLKSISTLLLIFTISFSSAAIVSFAEWDDLSNSMMIENGDSANFAAHFSANPHPMQISVTLYDSSFNTLNTFYSSNFNNDFFSQMFTITQGMYGSSGSYEIVAQGMDAAGNTDSQTIYLTVTDPLPPVDNTAPIITLLGDNPQEIQLGDPYVEQWATAIDNVDGDLTSQITIDSSLVNINAVGLYTITYSVSDSSSNSAIEFRIVNVTDSILPPVDNTAPVIALQGDDPQLIQLGNPYTELGAIAIDDVDGDLTSQIVIDTTDVNTSEVGLYTVTYNVNDSSNNQAVEVLRIVNVTDSPNPIDDEAPIITVISPDNGKVYKTQEIDFEVELNENATVFYNLNGGNNITMYETSSLTFEHGRILSYGNYTVTFYAIDEAGNLGEEIIDFSIEKEKIIPSDGSSGYRRKEKNETIVNYFEAGVKDNTAEEVSFSTSSTSIKLGYLVIFLLSMGVIVLILLIILLAREQDEQKKALSKEYAKIFEDDFN